jgi:hypothetical protein
MNYEQLLITILIKVIIDRSSYFIIFFKNGRIMVTTLSDQTITDLINEKKVLPKDYKTKIQIKPKWGHKERELDILGEKGGDYRLILRQSNSNQLDFSIILAYRPSESNQLFRLRRYNGKSHEHTNHIENTSFYDFHIHQATERYQTIGTNEDAFANPTDRYADYHQALSCMIKDCGFETPIAPQVGFFFEEV